MAAGEPCRISVLTTAGGEHGRIAFGDEGPEWWLGAQLPSRCHDCGVGTGGFHHFGCDMEMCPQCGGQLLTCGCSQR
jgi:hypothetical protein